jgi:hypothetical protein
LIRTNRFFASGGERCHQKILNTDLRKNLSDLMGEKYSLYIYPFQVPIVRKIQNRAYFYSVDFKRGRPRCIFHGKRAAPKASRNSPRLTRQRSTRISVRIRVTGRSPQVLMLIMAWQHHASGRIGLGSCRVRASSEATAISFSQRLENCVIGDRRRFRTRFRRQTFLDDSDQSYGIRASQERYQN